MTIGAAIQGNIKEGIRRIFPNNIQINTTIIGPAMSSTIFIFQGTLSTHFEDQTESVTFPRASN